jgi:hypothetical protein
MLHIKLHIRYLGLFGLLFSTMILEGQVKTGNLEYQPEPGQEGKDVRWFPTPQALVEKMLDMAEITSSDFLIDLGSGDGRTVISAAKRGVHAIGIEYNPDLVELSKKTAEKEGVKDRTDFIKTDLFKYDFSKATVITMFLLPEINLSLRPILLKMKPGTRIVSTTFTMQNWKYDDMVKVEDKTSNWTTAYLWIVPANAEGTWKFSDCELKLYQQFQMVTGQIIKGGQSVNISGGRLRGKNLVFNAEGKIYNCSLEGDTMTGTISFENQVVEWEAKRRK